MIEKEQVVTINYRLKEDNDKGNLIEETYGKEPLSFIYGIGGMIPKFEEELKGMKEGDKFAFTLAPEEAYGTHNAEAIVDLPKNIFEVEGKIEDGLLVVGNVIPMNDAEGNRMDGIIKELADETVKMDFNHPLAGAALHFEGDVVSTRVATAEEVEHGHVHGEGGHQH